MSYAPPSEDVAALSPIWLTPLPVCVEHLGADVLYEQLMRVMLRRTDV